MAGTKLTLGWGKTNLERMNEDSPTRSKFNKITIGIGTTDPLQSDTELEDSIPIQNTELVDGCDVTTGWTPSTDVVLAINNSIYKEGTGAIEFTKTGATQTSVNVTKDVTSLDFTSKGLSVWMYFVDQATIDLLAGATGLKIRYGSDSSNYYEWVKDSSDFTVGWNLFHKLTSANADSTTGTPVLATMDYFYIELNVNLVSNVWSAGDVIFDDIKAVSADDYRVAEFTGFPSYDLVTLQTTHKGFIATTQANGYFLGEAGVENTDGTPLLGIHSVFNGFSKDNTDELVPITKNRLRLNETTS